MDEWTEGRMDPWMDAQAKKNKNQEAPQHLGLENTVLGHPNLSWSDRRWSFIIGQPMRHLLSQMFQQHIYSATRINSHLTDVTMLG